MLCQTYILDHPSLLSDGVNRDHSSTNLLSNTACFSILDVSVTYLFKNNTELRYVPLGD